MNQFFCFAVNHSVNYDVSPSLIRWEQEIFTSEDSELTFEDSLELVHQSLLQSVRQRFESIPEVVFKNPSQEESKEIEYQETRSEVAVLFSGGIDSTLLAALICEVCQDKKNEGTPKVSSIDLLTICFGRNSSDLLTSIISYHQLCQKFPTVKLNLIIIEKTQKDIELLESGGNYTLKRLIHPKSSHMDFNIACALHLASQEAFFSQEFFQEVIEAVSKS